MDDLTDNSNHSSELPDDNVMVEEYLQELKSEMQEESPEDSMPEELLNEIIVGSYLKKCNFTIDNNTEGEFGTIPWIINENDEEILVDIAELKMKESSVRYSDFCRKLFSEIKKIKIGAWISLECNYHHYKKENTSIPFDDFRVKLEAWLKDQDRDKDFIYDNVIIRLHCFQVELSSPKLAMAPSTNYWGKTKSIEDTIAKRIEEQKETIQAAQRPYILALIDRTGEFTSKDIEQIVLGKEVFKSVNGQLEYAGKDLYQKFNAVQCCMCGILYMNESESGWKIDLINMHNVSRIKPVSPIFDRFISERTI